MIGKILVIAIVICLDYSNCLDLCGDWTQYKDIKCIKVLKKNGTEEEALNACSKLDQSSILLTIHSKDEQDYLSALLEKYHNISLNVWIGMKYSENAFKWMDGTTIDYTNWSEDSTRDGSTPCVEMSLQKESIGKWSDVLCKKIALIICQKKQEFNLNIVKNALENMTKVIENQKNELSKQQNLITSQNNKIENLTKVIENQEKQFNELKEDTIQTILPVGYLYTQLPNQSSPQELWPNLKWTEVTKDFSGLFFRAEGGGSESFGTIQPANQSSISEIGIAGCVYPSWTGTETCDSWLIKSIDPTIWSQQGFTGALWALKIYKTRGEVRPKNTAIRIFKRIK